MDWSCFNLLSEVHTDPWHSQIMSLHFFSNFTFVVLWMIIIYSICSQLNLAPQKICLNLHPGTWECDLFLKQDIYHRYNQVKDLKMKVGAILSGGCSYRRKERGTWNTESQEKIPREDSVTLPWTKACQETPKAGRGEAESSPRAFRGSMAPSTPDFTLSASRTERE